MRASPAVAVCFSGQLRTFAENWPHLHTMFRAAAGGHDPDYFFALHATDAPALLSAMGATVPASYQVQHMQRARDFDGTPIVYPTVHVDQAARAAWEQWQGLLSCGRQVRLFEEIRGRRYDWVIRCRPDLAVLHPMEILSPSLPHAVHVPRHNNWGGLNDRFAFGPSAFMEKYFAYPMASARFFVAGATRPKRNPEGMLKWHLDNEGVPIARTAAVLMPNRSGKIDEPVYRADRGDIQ